MKKALIALAVFVLFGPIEILLPKLLLSYVFLGKLGMGLFFELYFFSLTMGRLEMTYKPNRYADLFTMLLFLALVCLALEVVITWGGAMLLSKSFVMAITYVFCKRNPNEKMMLMFFLKIKAVYLPFALAAMELINNEGNVSSLYSSLAGIAAGHLFVYFKDILPVSHKRDFLATPQWMVRLVNKVQNSSLPYVGQGGAAQAFGMNQEGHRVFQGRGLRVG